MPQKPKSSPPAAAVISAQVFLRSPQGRSFRECATGPLPDDLNVFRASPEATAEVRRHFEKLGFRVFEDDLHLALTIEAPATKFQEVFGIQPAGKEAALKASPLATPPEISALVDQIVLTSPPEYF